MRSSARTLRGDSGREHAAGGFTLVEVTASLAIAGILMLGLASAIVLATHAMPQRDSIAQRLTTAGTVVDRMAEELESATAVLARSATGVTILVPDRNGDTIPEKIAYAWSGTPGDPLTRRYNLGLQETVLEEVEDLQFDWQVQPVVEAYPGPAAESVEKLLADYQPLLPNLNAFKIERTHWLAQLIQPIPTPGTVGWRPTKVHLKMQSDGAPTEYSVVELREPALDGSPSAVVYGSANLNESTLPLPLVALLDILWTQVAIPAQVQLPPGAGISLVVRHSGTGNASGRLVYDHGLSVGGMFETTDSGASWVEESGNRLLHRLYGTTFSPGPDQAIQREYLTHARVDVTCASTAEGGGGPPAISSTAVEFLNEPELASAFWLADFDADPTKDRNGDGSADWVVVGGGVFNTANLSKGIWLADSTIETFPNSGLTEPVTIDVHMRAADVGATAGLQVFPGWSGSDAGQLQLDVQLLADSTHLLVFRAGTSATTSTVLATITGLPPGFVRVRLLIDPSRDSVSLTVNDVHRGTYTYRRYAQLVQTKRIQLGATGGAAEMDFVFIRVGGTPG